MGQNYSQATNQSTLAVAGEFENGQERKSSNGSSIRSSNRNSSFRRNKSGNSNGPARRANLKSELDNMSSDNEDDDYVHALEYGEANDNNQFFDVDADGGAEGNNVGAGTPISEEEREQLQQELKKTEDEITTLRQVLTARLKYANDLKRKLGVTPWREVQQDLTQGVKNVKESPAFQRTEEALHQASEAVSKKLGQIRTSNTFKSFEEKFGSAYSSVKAKIAASTSIDQLSGHGQKEQTSSAAGTQPTTPSNEKARSP